MTSIIQSVSRWLINFSKENIEEREEMVGEYDLIHVGQKHNWDCGVACLEMCLRWWRVTKPDLPISGVNIVEFDNTESPLWTIDIFISLHKNGVDGAVMYTNFKGIAMRINAHPQSPFLLMLFCG